MEPNIFGKVLELAQNNLPCVGLAAIALIGLGSGWITPFFSEDQRFKVINEYRKLTSHIRTQKYLKHKPDPADVNRRRFLMITRGAGVHSFIQKKTRN